MRPTEHRAPALTTLEELAAAMKSPTFIVSDWQRSQTDNE